MIKELHLTNFRKHENTATIFNKGLTVLKGANEHGKTTILESILYAMYGAKALRTPLADTVTYGKSENALKVVMLFEFDGVEYSITRAKSGAELRYAGNVVTGQTEVRSFMERLLGATADTATSLLFADQNAVRGVLAGGAAAAGSLVEKLANLDIIEGLVERIQAQLPTGNTNILVGQIGALERSIHEELIAPDDTECKLALANFKKAKADADTFALNNFTSEEIGLKAENTIAKAKLIKITNAEVMEKRKKWTEVAEAPISEPRVSMEQIVQNEVAALDAEKAQKRWNAYKTIFDSTDQAWEGTNTAFYKKLAETPDQLKTLNKQIQEIKLNIRSKQAMLINEKECSFCKKDLSNVPEVAEINLAVTEEIGKYKIAVDQLEDFYANLEAEYDELKKLERVTNNIKIKADSNYWEVSNDIPPVAKWKGDPPVAPDAVMDMSQYRKQWVTYTELINKREAAKTVLGTLTLVEEVDITEAEAILKECEEYEKELALKLRHAVSLETLYDKALSAYDKQVAVHHMQLLAKDKARQDLENLKESIAKMEAHNALIKKLRSARGPITSKLWNTVLAGVAYHFERIRGTASVVTRDAEGFKVDGRSVAGLSGSTLDSLGLAIRIALSKLFLPNARFMFLDEVAAGCDEQRELAMLGVVAAAGFEQVLLVTHSNLGDSLADNLVSLG